MTNWKWWAETVVEAALIIIILFGLMMTTAALGFTLRDYLSGFGTLLNDVLPLALVAVGGWAAMAYTLFIPLAKAALGWLRRG